MLGCVASAAAAVDSAALHVNLFLALTPFNPTVPNVYISSCLRYSVLRRSRLLPLLPLLLLWETSRQMSLRKKDLRV